MITIRNEKPQDYKIVEDMTRKAFYNQYMPGCFEPVSYTHLDVYKRQQQS